ncbi:MAG: MMPL family transporter [Gammaproteobacteria bacterium]
MFSVATLTSASQRGIEAIVEFCAGRARSLLALLFALTTLAGWFVATHLKVNTDTEGMLDPSLPFMQTNRAYDAAFPQFDNLIVVVVQGKSQAESEDVSNAIAERLRGSSDTISYVYQPGGGDFFERNGLLYLDADALFDVYDKLSEAAPFLGTMAHDPSIRGLFRMLGRALDEDLDTDAEVRIAQILEKVVDVVEAQSAGRARPIAWRDAWLDVAKPADAPELNFILLQPRVDYSTLSPLDAALENVHKVIEEVTRSHPFVKARVTGSAAMEAEELINVSQDGTLTSALSLALVCLLLIIAFQSLPLVTAVLATLCVGLVWTTAIALALFGHLTLISVSFAVLFIGMGVDFGIQFGLRYEEELERSGGDYDATLIRTARGVGPSLVLAGLAAAIGFFAFAPTSYKGLAELGVIAGSSMLVALTLNLTLLPALLSLWRVRLAARSGRWNPLLGLGPIIRRRRRAVLGVAVVAVLATAVLVPRMRFDFNPINLRDPTTEAVETFKELLDDPKSSPYTIDLLAPDPVAAQALAARVEKVPLVDSAVTLASYVPDNQDEKLGIIADMNVALAPAIAGDTLAPPAVAQNVEALAEFRDKLQAPDLAQRHPGFARVAPRLADAFRALEAQPGWPERTVEALQPNLLGDFSKILDRLRKLLDAQEVTMGNLPPELRSQYVAADGRTRIEVFPKENLNDNDALKRFVAAVRTVAPHAGGAPVTMVEGGDAVVEGSLFATMFALAATSVLMLVLLRRPGKAALALVPVLLAIVLTVGTSVLLDLPFNFANIVALPLLIGLASAFGIYLVLRKDTGMDVDRLFRSSTPVAILFSALTTLASFGCLAIARHPGMSMMGVLISVALGFAIISAIVVVPAVMAEVDARRGPPPAG